jgi:catechol 2,3-dioxygenase
MDAAHSQPPFGVRPDGFRLPARAHVGAVRLLVSDLARSTNYYEQVIGLEVLGRERDAAVLGARGDALALVRLEAGRNLAPAPRRPVTGLFHFAILLPERAALARFVAHLSRLGVPHGSADHLVSEALYLSDPDGLGIEVYSDRPPATWRHEGGELAMTTDPLDLASLLPAAGGGSWTGAPVGTTIGHVHLRVGDLREARRFYQDALGFDLTVWSYPGALFFAAGGYHHHLGTNTWGAPGAAAGDHARLLEWELHVPGAAAEAAAHVREAGYRVEESGGEVPAVRDPWGTRLVLRAD